MPQKTRDAYAIVSAAITIADLQWLNAKCDEGKATRSSIIARLVSEARARDEEHPHG